LRTRAEVPEADGYRRAVEMACAASAPACLTQVGL
jgi:hypothetical protein